MDYFTDLEIRWAHLKEQIATFTTLSHWSLHVVIGLTVLAATSLAFRRHWPSLWLLAPAGLMELVNEVSDISLFYAAGKIRHWHVYDTTIEIALTLLPGAVILCVMKYRRHANRRNV